eukprot:4628985-Amphidinium_carterae.1
MRAAYYFYDPQWDERLVGKRYMATVPSEKYKADVEMQHYAKCIAQEANETLSVAGIKRAFNFLLPWLVWVPGTDETYSMEHLMPGDYAKYNNNAGWATDEEGGQMAVAFSHFSHRVTTGYAMIVDLQGIGGWCFTDPQVHCIDRKRFGLGNLGHEGMRRFFLGHQCNTFCQKLGLRPETPEVQPEQEVRSVSLSSIEHTARAFCAVCGSGDVVVNAKELAKKAKHRKDVFCQKHLSRYYATQHTEKCAVTGCTRELSYSKWYLQLHGLSAPIVCSFCDISASCAPDT